jgi:hypothetical protein
LQRARGGKYPVGLMMHEITSIPRLLWVRLRKGPPRAPPPTERNFEPYELAGRLARQHRYMHEAHRRGFIEHAPEST